MKTREPPALEAAPTTPPLPRPWTARNGPDDGHGAEEVPKEVGLQPASSAAGDTREVLGAQDTLESSIAQKTP